MTKPDTLAKLAAEYHPTMTLEVLHSWAADVTRALTAQAPAAAEPMFWVRLVGDDGLYEGPVHHKSVGGKMLRDEKPGEWHPLYLGTAPQAAQQAAQAPEGWVNVEDRLPTLPDDDENVPVYVWDGLLVSEDEYGAIFEQPAGPAVGGWLRVGDGFLGDMAGRVTHWALRKAPAPPAARPQAEGA